MPSSIKTKPAFVKETSESICLFSNPSSLFFVLALAFLFSNLSVAQPLKKLPKKIVPSSTKVNNSPRVPASTGANGLSPVITSGEGKSLEIRGQTRNLSMMLILKNGKESINFIKVRKDFRPEILTTDF